MNNLCLYDYMQKICCPPFFNFVLNSQVWYLTSNELEMIKCKSSTIEIHNVLHCTKMSPLQNICTAVNNTKFFWQLLSPTVFENNIAEITLS